MKRVVITGTGVVSAIGIGKKETLSALLEGKSGIGEVRYLQTSHKNYPVGEVKLSNEELQSMVGVDADNGEPQSRNAMIARLAVKEALEEAGLTTNGKADEKALAEMAFISGTTVAGMDRAESTLLNTELDKLEETLLSSLSDCGNNTEDIARGFGKFALVDTISTACSSAANAIMIGANMIKTGLFDRVLVGGSESLSLLHFNGFKTLMILDQELCRPFDANRAGLNLGEGAAYLVLESEESAVDRGAKPIAILSGYGNACDAFHQTASSDDGEGAFLAMSKAISMAGIKPSDIDYISAHGTGTPNNDPSELAAMHRVFGDLPPFSSTKGFTGHTTSASGSIETVFCILAMQNGFLPINLNLAQPIEGEPMPVVLKPETLKPGTLKPETLHLKHILCNAFGFGGNDSSLVISSLDSLEKEDDGDIASGKKVYVLVHKTMAETDPDFKQFMTAGEARRLGRLLKRTLALSVEALRESGIAKPDAIITGTEWGSIESSKMFLIDMHEHGEEMLKPTHFMQSTHNTLSSLIAISTANHGYNNTHSQRDNSMRMALMDAWMLMQLGLIKTALVGRYDALPEMRNELYLLATEDAIPEGMTIVEELKF